MVGLKEDKECFRANIVKKIFAKGPELESWFARKEMEVPTPPYTSVDLRDSCFKVVPVDSNAFPGGFNNICNEDWAVAARGFTRSLQIGGKAPKRVVIVPENHTNNKFYLENLRALREMLVLGGFETIIGHTNTKLEDNVGEGVTKLETSSGQQIVMERLYRKGDSLSTSNTSFQEDDLILLNNDLSTGIPPELENLSLPIAPNPSMGWFKRKKGNHLEYYCHIAHEVAELLEVDPFQITARFDVVNDIDFSNAAGMDRVAAATEHLLERIRADYKEHGVDAEPFVFIKDNSGTYGRAIMPVKSGDEVLSMNRRAKNKMNVSKGGVQVESVLLMEGIPTALSEGEESAEPVIYLAGHEPIGGFLRLHPEKGDRGNLNAPGAHFKTLCFANLFKNPTPETVVLEKFYGLLGRLSSLANAQEMK